MAYGFAKQEKSLPFDAEEQAAAMAQIMLAPLPADEYPYLVEFMAKHVLQPGYNYAQEFTFGLDLAAPGFVGHPLCTSSKWRSPGSFIDLPQSVASRNRFR